MERSLLSPSLPESLGTLRIKSFGSFAARCTRGTLAALPCALSLPSMTRMSLSRASCVDRLIVYANETADGAGASACRCERRLLTYLLLTYNLHLPTYNNILHYLSCLHLASESREARPHCLALLAWPAACDPGPLS